MSENILDLNLNMAALESQSDTTNTALSSTLELVSKLDPEKYSWTLKCDDGNINLEILDKIKQPPSEKICKNNSGHVTSFRTLPEKRSESRGARGMHVKQKSETSHVATLDSKSKSKRKSPSERKRDNKRHYMFLSVKNKSETSESSCQTLLETSNKMVQNSPETCDTHSQTSSASSPGREGPSRPPDPAPYCFYLTCEKSSKPGSTMKKCSKCKVATYCSINCQSADWPIHRRVCGQLKDAS